MEAIGRGRLVTNTSAMEASAQDIVERENASAMLTVGLLGKDDLPHAQSDIVDVDDDVHNGYLSGPPLSTRAQITLS